MPIILLNSQDTAETYKPRRLCFVAKTVLCVALQGFLLVLFLLGRINLEQDAAVHTKHLDSAGSRIFKHDKIALNIQNETVLQAFFNLYLKLSSVFTTAVTAGATAVSANLVHCVVFIFLSEPYDTILVVLVEGLMLNEHEISRRSFYFQDGHAQMFRSFMFVIYFFSLTVFLGLNATLIWLSLVTVAYWVVLYVNLRQLTEFLDSILILLLHGITFTMLYFYYISTLIWLSQNLISINFCLLMVLMFILIFKICTKGSKSVEVYRVMDLILCAEITAIALEMNHMFCVKYQRVSCFTEDATLFFLYFSTFTLAPILVMIRLFSQSTFRNNCMLFCRRRY